VYAHNYVILANNMDGTWMNMCQNYDNWLTKLLQLKMVQFLARSVY